MFHKIYERRILIQASIVLTGLLTIALPAAGQGIALRGVGPVNESMGGVATACPIDATGALHWNPATISGLSGSDMSFGVGLLLPTTQLSSRIGANALGPGNPPIDIAGSDNSEPGISAIPTMAFVYQPEDSCWTYGLGVYGIGGSHVNYPASTLTGTHNPVLFAQPSGLGRLSAAVDVLQIAPTVSYELTERLSIGFAPTLTLANLSASPLFLGPKNLVGTYPEGIGYRYTWGGGFQAGLYYITDYDWHFGASVKSPQWMEPFRFRTQDSDGSPKVVEYHLDYPLIVSVGASYTGFENWIIGSDIRFFNYSNTAGFGSGGFDAQGALLGLDWKDVVSVSLGAQRKVTERLFLRMGYCYNDNPITSEASQYNVASPLITQHTIHCGGSYMFADNWLASISYTHAFHNSVTGPLHPAGTSGIPNTSVTSDVSADLITVGFSKRF